MEFNNPELDKLQCSVLAEDLITHHAAYKLIIIGDTGVGKSCLMMRGTKNEFREDHDITIGVEYGSFSLNINGKSVKMLIWDTAGQETFQSVAKVFYKGSHCIFLVYDITKEKTFNKLQTWLKEVRETASANVMIVLVGNMLDLEPKRAVTKEQAKEFKAKENLDAFIETSAKSGENVQEVFLRAAKALFWRDREKLIPKQKGIKIDKANNKEKRNCQC